MSQIFISYSRKDSQLVEKIVDALTEDDLKPWIDWKHIPKGEEVQKEIHHAIEESEIFLFFVSPDSVVSKWCIDEVEHAPQNSKRILPIIIRETDPTALHNEISKRNWIFCRKGQDDFATAIEEIRKTIHTDYAWLKYHTELQVKALRWEQKKDNSRLLRGKELREAEQQLDEVGAQEDLQPTEIQREYLYVSQGNEIRQRRQITSGLGFGLVVASVLVIFAWTQRNEAISKAKISRASEISSLSLRLGSESGSSFIESGLLSIEANNLSPDLQSNQAIMKYMDIAGLPVYQFQHSEGVISIALSADGRILLTGGGDGFARAWDLQTGTKISEVQHASEIYSVALISSRKLAISGSADGDLKIWNWLDGKEISRLKHNDAVTSIAVTASGSVVASGSTDGTLKIWNADTNKIVANINAGVITNTFAKSELKK